MKTYIIRVCYHIFRVVFTNDLHDKVVQMVASLPR